MAAAYAVLLTLCHKGATRNKPYVPKSVASTSAVLLHGADISVPCPCRLVAEKEVTFVNGGDAAPPMVIAFGHVFYAAKAESCLFRFLVIVLRAATASSFRIVVRVCPFAAKPAATNAARNA